MRGLTFSLVCALVALAPIALRVLIMPVSPHDFWWHMAQGRLIAQTGGVPVVDHFSWTQDGRLFFDQSWLAQVAFYYLHNWGGVPLVVLVQTLCVVACYAVTLWLAAQRSSNTRLAALLLMLGVLPLSLDNWQIRPQTFALPLFAATLLILTAYRLRWFHLLPALPVLMAIWVNTHGGFEQGLAMIAVTLVGEAISRKIADRKQRDATSKVTGSDALFSQISAIHPPLSLREWRVLAIWSVLSFGATLLNPRGIQVYYYVHDVLRHPSTQFSSEWGKPTFGEFTGAWFWCFLAVMASLLSWRRPKMPLTDWLLVILFLLAAMVSGRSMLWFGIVALPFLATALARQAGEKRDEPPLTRVQAVMNGVVVAIAWLPVLLTLPWWKPSLGLPPNVGALLDPQTPISAVRFLRTLPAPQRPRRLYHTEGTGSYLCWAAPEQKVWIDTRFELYPPQQWRDAIALGRGQKVSVLLAKYRFDGAMLELPRQKLLQRKLRELGWRDAYHDEHTALLVRR